jgi:hypothetical protein
MAVDLDDPKMEGYKPLGGFRYRDRDYSSRVRDYPEEKEFLDLVLKLTGADPAGTTQERPTPSVVGTRFFDATLGQPIWWNGFNWVNAMGGAV